MKYSLLKCTSKHFVFLGLLFSGAWPGAVKAKELYFQPVVNVRTEYSDNKRLKEDGFKAVNTEAYGIITRLGAKAGARSDNYNILLNNQFIIRRYESDFDLDSDDFNFELTSDFQLSEKNQVGIRSNYTRNTTLTSAFEDNGTGLVQDNIERQQWFVKPSWNYSLSDTQSINVSYNHLEVDYEESELSSLVDYTIDNVSLSFQQRWTPLFSNTISFTAMSFDVPKIDIGFGLHNSRDTTEYSINLGTEYQFTPTWSTSVTVGSRFTNTETTTFVNTPIEKTISEDLSDFVFSLNLIKTFETGNARISYSRSSSAQGSGQLQLRDNLLGTFVHRFNHSLFFLLNSSISVISTSGNKKSGSDRTFYYIKPSLRWRVDEQFTVSAEYEYRGQTIENNDNKAKSNAIGLNFIYKWDALTTQKY